MRKARKDFSRGFQGTRSLRLTVVTLTVFSLSIVATTARSAKPRVLKPGQFPADCRLQPLKDLDGYFPFPVPQSREAWQQRAERLRRQILVSQGLWPMPTKTDLKAVIHGRIEEEDYTIEKVFFESMPDFYVTGNLYRPRNVVGRVPGVLCPHGHWSNGRFHDCGLDSVRQQIVEGAERFEDGGRSPLQSRCVQLARMGCVVFHWDMIGYADSQQISTEIIHGFSKQRKEMNRLEGWGLFSPQAESRFQSPMGLQTYNSIRALDFLISLPDVDAKRIAVTGASGGGTQTFILAAIDPRPTVAFPAVMVSTAMQGGCTCENACGLRVGTGNVEIAALFAPKPLGLSAANDWTKEMATKGFPELQQLFQLFNAKQNVMLKPLVHFGHNYNNVSRAAMYHWLNRGLQLGLAEPIVEEAYQRQSKAELTVWNDDHPRPKGGPEFERELLSWWANDAQRQLRGLRPTDAKSLDRYRRIVGDAIDIVIGRNLPNPDELDFEATARVDLEGYTRIEGLLTHRLKPAVSNEPLTGEMLTEQLPVVLLYPDRGVKRVVIWLCVDGKDGLFQENGAPRPQVQRLVDAGIGVVGADLLFQGEFLEPGQVVETTRKVENPREAAAYTFGYNAALFARRVHDILSIVAYALGHSQRPEEIDLVGLSGAGPWVAAARAQARSKVTRAAIDSGGFRFAHIRQIHDPSFLPGGAKYHDLPGMLAVAAPGRLWLAGEKEQSSGLLTDAYRAAGKEDAISMHQGPPETIAHAAVDWLLGE